MKEREYAKTVSVLVTNNLVKPPVCPVCESETKHVTTFILSATKSGLNGYAQILDVMEHVPFYLTPI